MGNAHFDFLGKSKISYIVMIVVLAVSCVSFAVRGLNMGAEFTGGRAYVIRFDRPVQAEEVRMKLQDVFSGYEDAANVSFEVKQYGNENQMRIVTQYKMCIRDRPGTDGGYCYSPCRRRGLRGGACGAGHARVRESGGG